MKSRTMPSVLTLLTSVLLSIGVLEVVDSQVSKLAVPIAPVELKNTFLELEAGEFMILWMRVTREASRLHGERSPGTAHSCPIIILL